MDYSHTTPIRIPKDMGNLMEIGTSVASQGIRPTALEGALSQSSGGLTVWNGWIGDLPGVGHGR